MTNGQTAELIALFAKKVPLDMSDSVAQGWIENPSAFEKAINVALVSSIVVKSNMEAVSDWQDFYKRFFGLTVDLSSVRVPTGLDRTIYIPKGISINAAVNAHKNQNIPYWQYHSLGNLESAMRKSECGLVKVSYAIRVWNDQEADSDLHNLSAEDIEKRGIDTESLLERLVHGLKYYDETGEYLDVRGATLCASSRYANGGEPLVSAADDGVIIPDAIVCTIGARRVVR